MQKPRSASLQTPLDTQTVAASLDRLPPESKTLNRDDAKSAATKSESILCAGATGQVVAEDNTSPRRRKPRSLKSDSMGECSLDRVCTHLHLGCNQTSIVR